MMKNVYLDHIGELKRLYAKLESQPENEDVRTAYHKLFEVIFQYFEDLSRTDEVTESDMKDATGFKYFMDGLDSKLIWGANRKNASRGFWPPRDLDERERYERYVAERYTVEAAKQNAAIREVHERWAKRFPPEIYANE